MSNVVSISAEPRLTSNRRLAKYALLSMVGMYFASFFLRSAIPGTIFNDLQKEWNLSASAVVGLGSIYLWVYGSMQLVVGITADRFGGARTLLVGGIILAVGATASPFATTPGMLYATRALTAIGDSFVYLCIIKEVSLLFEQRRFALLVGVVQFFGPLGGMMAMLPFDRAAHFFGWRHALLAAGVFTCGVVVVNYLILPKLDPFVPHTTKFTLRPVWEIFCHRPNWPMFVCALINFPVYFVVQIGIGKKFIQDFVGLEPAQAATFTLIMMTVSAVVALGSSFLLRHTGGKRKPWLILSIGMLLGAVLLLLTGVYFKLSAWVFLTGYILLAISNIASPIGTTVVKELNEHRYVAQALALINTIAYLGVAMVMVMSGTVLDLFKGGAVQSATGVLVYPPRAYEAVFIIYGLLAIVSMVATMFVHETHNPQPADEMGEPPDPFN